MSKKTRKTDQYLTIRVRRIDDPQVWERKSCGKTTGLSIYETIAVLFQANELAPKTRKLTDEAITQFVAAEFPKSKGVAAMLNRTGGRTLNHYRSLYNKGKLTGTKPMQPSQRWTYKGELANLRTGRPLKKGKN